MSLQGNNTLIMQNDLLDANKEEYSLSTVESLSSRLLLCLTAPMSRMFNILNIQ